jgi:hypothetical protein
MSTISKTLLAVLVGVLVGGATYVMAAPGGKTSQRSIAPAAAMTTKRTVDVKGPCDEAEHANDPRCVGPQRPEDRPNHDRNRAEDRHQAGDHQVADDDGPLHDIGDDNPAEHHGNRGPGSLNSGPGNARNDDGPNHDVGDDHGGSVSSGSGSDDTGFDDHGGSGHSGSDDSGSGHSESDG